MIIKRGDKHPIRWKANLDLTGATVRLIAKPRNGDPIPLEATITDAAQGVVTHQLDGTLGGASQTTYRVELEVASGGQIITFPNGSYATLTVMPDLD